MYIEKPLDLRVLLLLLSLSLIGAKRESFFLICFAENAPDNPRFNKLDIFIYICIYNAFVGTILSLGSFQPHLNYSSMYVCKRFTYTINNKKNYIVTTHTTGGVHFKPPPD